MEVTHEVDAKAQDTLLVSTMFQGHISWTLPLTLLVIWGGRATKFIAFLVVSVVKQPSSAAFF